MKEFGRIIASLYIYGDDLDPESISVQLGQRPTRSHLKGQKKLTSTGSEVVYKTGMWETTTASKSTELSDHIEELASRIKISGDSIRKIAGVEEAHFDFLISDLFDEHGIARSEFKLTKENIATLHRFDLPVLFTVTASEPE